MGKRKKNNAAADDIKRSAVGLVNTDGMIERTGKRTWKIRSESCPDCWYTVRRTNKRIICTCPYHTKRKGAPCKHTVAVEAWGQVHPLFMCDHKQLDSANRMIYKIP